MYKTIFYKSIAPLLTILVGVYGSFAADVSMGQQYPKLAHLYNYGNREIQSSQLPGCLIINTSLPYSKKQSTSNLNSCVT